MTCADAVQEDLVVTPPDVVVRRDEIDEKEEPAPFEEDEEVLDPAVAVVCDPVAGLLVAVAEHGVIGVTAALPADDAAAQARVATVTTTSQRRAPFSDEDISGELLFDLAARRT